MNWLTVVFSALIVMNGVTGVKAQTPKPSDSPAFIGGFCFDSLYYLMNKAMWPNMSNDGHRLKSGLHRIALSKPLEIVIINNGWHLPMARNDHEDIRYKDLEKHILRDEFIFSNTIPEYDAPGYIAIIQLPDKNRVLVARIRNGFLLEDRNGIGIVLDK